MEKKISLRMNSVTIKTGRFSHILIDKGIDTVNDHLAGVLIKLIYVQFFERFFHALFSSRYNRRKVDYFVYFILLIPALISIFIDAQFICAGECTSVVSESYNFNSEKNSLV